MTDVERPKSKWPYYVGIALIIIALTFSFWGEKARKWLNTGAPTGANISEQPVYVYDFSKEKAPVKLEVRYYKDKCVGVTLPVGVNFRKDSTSDILTYYPMDGKKAISGPGKQANLPGGLARTVQQITGLENSGTLTIYLEKTKK